MADLPEFISGIILGNHDDGLDRISQAVKTRREVINLAKKSTMTVGTRVRFNGQTKPRYLVGKVGTVTKVNQKRVTVDLDERVTSPQSTRSWYRNIQTPVGLVEVVE